MPPQAAKAPPQTISFDDAVSSPEVTAQTGDERGNRGVAGNFQDAFDELTTPKMHSADQGVIGNIGTGLENVGKGALSLLAPVFHPVDTAKALFPTKNIDEPGAFDIRQDPMVKPFIDHPLEAAEQMGGAMLGGRAAGGVLNGGGKMLSRAMDPVSAYRSPLIPENEAIARAATDVIKPGPNDYRGMVKNLQTNLPNIKEHLNTAGVPKLSSPLEFAKGATGSGQNFSKFYQEHIIAPNADAPVGGGTVGSSYARLGEINDKLRPIYRARSMGEQMTKEAQDNMAALEKERDQLNNNLYGVLSERTGLPVEHIRDINQRGAQMQSVGDVTDTAQSLRRSGFGGYTPMGAPIPLGPIDKAMKAVDYLRGGSEAVAGRKLARILKEVKDEPTALPNADDISNHRMNYQAQEADAASANRATTGTRLKKILQERTDSAYPKKLKEQ